MVPMLKSWKTTLAGAITGLALMAQAAELPLWARYLAWVLAGAGAVALGVLSRDNTKTSEDVGAPHATKPISLEATEIAPSVDTAAIATAIQDAARALLDERAKAAQSPPAEPPQ